MQLANLRGVNSWAPVENKIPLNSLAEIVTALCDFRWLITPDYLTRENHHHKKIVAPIKLLTITFVLQMNGLGEQMYYANENGMCIRKITDKVYNQSATAWQAVLCFHVANRSSSLFMIK